METTTIATAVTVTSRPSTAQPSVNSTIAEEANAAQGVGARIRRRFSSVVDSIQPVIPSTGNIARDHLANERTFLAWLRTCLSLVGGGAALVKLDLAWIGNSFVVLGLFSHVLCVDT
eukprot:Opistho-1_new@85356